MAEAKSYEISKWDVVKAFELVKANHGAAGVDKISLEDFEKDLQGNLYKIWNRMSSGSYFPPPVRTVEIPKGDGKTRPLGIPTVGDRVAQQVVKMQLEPLVEPLFHDDSYGYRPGRSALDAVAKTRTRCWRQNWVIDLDIKGFFDNLDHELVMRAVRRHTTSPWIILYVERWLKAPAQKQDGTMVERTKGTPQGGVISPLLANLFMHYAFDTWIARTYPDVQFARYADDAVVHVASKERAMEVLAGIRQRLGECKLEVHPEKTKVVYCKDDDRPGDHDHTSFDFLGFSFRPRGAKNRWGKLFVSCLPAISVKARKKVRQKIRSWKISRRRSNQTLEDIAALVNPSVRGWFNYYGKFYPSMVKITLRYLEQVMVKWMQDKFKKLRVHQRRAWHCLGRIARSNPGLFVLWQIGVVPAAGSYEPSASRDARLVR